MITFKIIASTTSTSELKTRTHEKTYTVHECIQSQRIGYVMESVRSYKDGKLFKATQCIKSFYFGFPNCVQAERFEEFAKRNFPKLAEYGTNCESRLSKRLKSPFEVKIRNLSAIGDDLMIFFSKCIDRELSPKVVDIPLEIVKKRLANL